MKRIVFLMLAVVMMLALCVNVSAAGVQSPGKTEVDIKDVEPENPNDKGLEVVFVPFEDKNELDPAEKKAIEDTYKDITSGSNATGVQDILGDVAKEADKKLDEVVISDVFNMHVEGEKDPEGNFNVTLNIAEVSGFRALVCMNSKTGKWEVVDVKLAKDGKSISFSMKDFGTFAIVSDKTPETGDHSAVAIWMMLVSVAVFALAVVLLRKRKA